MSRAALLLRTFAVTGLLVVGILAVSALLLALQFTAAAVLFSR